MSTRVIADVRPARSRPEAARTGGGYSPSAPPRRTVELFDAWSSRQFPCTAQEEQAFVAALVAAQARRTGADQPSDWSRRDVTAIVTALRCGLTADDLLGRAPGLQPQRLLAAYAVLEQRRRDADAAWRQIVAAPSAATLEHAGPTAAALVPAVVSHLVRIAATRSVDLVSAAQRADREMHRTAARALAVEHLLTTCGAARAEEIGSVLFDCRGEGVWALNTFLPPRVGTLVPLRVAALLGESRDGEPARHGALRSGALEVPAVRR